jgi:diguanylate cyclase (GGDEF)-like protein
MSGPSRRHRGHWRRPPLWVAAAAVAIALVGLLDSRVESNVDLSLLYGAAVACSAWWLGRRYSAIAAVLAGVLWTQAELGSQASYPARFAVWNGFTHLVLFVFVAFATARVRSDRRRLGRSRRVLEEEIFRARTDLATELLNARGLLEQLDRDFSDPRRGLSFALATIDIDGFRNYEDDHAVTAAEDLGRKICAVIRKSIRASDTPSRLGRDEFAVAFRGVERDLVEKTLRRIISGIAALAAEDPEARVSASIGVAFYETPPDDPREVLRQSEKAMHVARGTGRGTLFVWEQEAEEGRKDKASVGQPSPGA